ncbi:MAG: hypothetical protein QHG98_07285 [Methanothrix sp.]|nr:hypothetical protein [Methanothrix sp.]
MSSEVKSNTIELEGSEYDKLVGAGWLGKDGICRFPDEVRATVAGVKSVLPLTWFKSATDADIEDAVNRGWIMFVDGDGIARTRAAYRARYPGYPDPLLMAKLLGRIPGRDKKFFELSRAGR